MNVSCNLNHKLQYDGSIKYINKYLYYYPQLLNSLNCLYHKKKNYCEWFNFPQIPYFQETYFWNVIQKVVQLENKHCYYILNKQTNVAMLFLKENTELPFYYWLLENPTQWLLMGTKRNNLINKIMYNIPFIFINSYDINSIYTLRTLLRSYILFKYKINTIKSNINYQNKKIIQNVDTIETQIQKAYQIQMETPEQLQEFNEIVKKVKDTYLDIFKKEKQNPHYKKWLQTNPVQKLHIQIRDIFPKKSHHLYPYTIPMFELMLKQLRRKLKNKKLKISDKK